jgi:hypothetical protein
MGLYFGGYKKRNHPVGCMDDLNIGVHNRWQHFECLLWRFHDLGGSE